MLYFWRTQRNIFYQCKINIYLEKCQQLDVVCRRVWRELPWGTDANRGSWEKKQPRLLLELRVLLLSRFPCCVLSYFSLVFVVKQIQIQVTKDSWVGQSTSCYCRTFSRSLHISHTFTSICIWSSSHLLAVRHLDFELCAIFVTSTQQ